MVSDQLFSADVTTCEPSVAINSQFQTDCRRIVRGVRGWIRFPMNFVAEALHLAVMMQKGIKMC